MNNYLRFLFLSLFVLILSSCNDNDMLDNGFENSRYDYYVTLVDSNGTKVNTDEFNGFGGYNSDDKVTISSKNGSCFKLRAKSTSGEAVEGNEASNNLTTGIKSDWIVTIDGYLQHLIVTSDNEKIFPTTGTGNYMAGEIIHVSVDVPDRQTFYLSDTWQEAAVKGYEFSKWELTDCGYYSGLEKPAATMVLHENKDGVVNAKLNKIHVFAVRPDLKLDLPENVKTDAIALALIDDDWFGSVKKWYINLTEPDRFTSYRWGLLQDEPEIPNFTYIYNYEEYHAYLQPSWGTPLISQANWDNGALSQFNAEGKKATEILYNTTASYTNSIAYYAHSFNSGLLNENWYVPAFGQLAIMYNYISEINTALEICGGEKISRSSTSYYFSSTEAMCNESNKSYFSWELSFCNGEIFIKDKSNGGALRLVHDIE